MLGSVRFSTLQGIEQRDSREVRLLLLSVPICWHPPLVQIVFHPDSRGLSDKYDLCTNLHPIGQLTHTRRSDVKDGAPESDGALQTVVRCKTLQHHRQIYLNRPDPIAFQSTLEAAFMMTSVVYYFCMITVKHLLWLMNYRRNRINFASFTLLV